MAVKYLDIDSVDVAIGTVKIFGKEYEVHQLSVKQLVNMIKMGEDAKPGDHLTGMAESIHAMIPDCPMDDLLNLSLEQMRALMAWTRDEVDQKNETPPSEAAKVETQAEVLQRI